MYFHAENSWYQPGRTLRRAGAVQRVVSVTGAKKVDPKSNQPAGLPRRAGRGQRLAIYIVISKPKRMSLAAGFSHFIR